MRIYYLKFWVIFFVAHYHSKDGILLSWRGFPRTIISLLRPRGLTFSSIVEEGLVERVAHNLREGLIFNIYIQRVCLRWFIYMSTLRFYHVCFLIEKKNSMCNITYLSVNRTRTFLTFSNKDVFSIIKHELRCEKIFDVKLNIYIYYFIRILENKIVFIKKKLCEKVFVSMLLLNRKHADLFSNHVNSWYTTTTDYALCDVIFLAQHKIQAEISQQRGRETTNCKRSDILFQHFFL